MSKDTSEAIYALAASITKIAHGDVTGPCGLEGLAMMTKEGLQLNAESIDGIGQRIEIAGASINEGLESVASAIQELAAVIGEQSK